MKKRNIVIGIICFIIILSGVLILILFNKSDDVDKDLLNLLQEKGFNSSEESVLLSKQVSSLNLDEFNNNVNNNISSKYEMRYFNIYSYSLRMEKIEYSSKIKKSLDSSFDYTTNTINYTYRIDYVNSSLILKGIYNSISNEFTCEKELTYLFDENASVNDFCNKVRYDLDDFSIEANNLITDKVLRNKMKEYVE